MGNWQSRVRVPEQGIRATVIGASQYTVQLSGSTIFVDPLDSLPMRNVPALLPDLPLMHEALNPGAIAEAIRAALFRQDLQDSDAPVGLCYRWQGSATYARLEAFSRGVIQGLGPLLSRGLPLVLVGDSDIGGLIGIHFHESKEFKNPIVSVDGVSLNAFDFFDIGEILDSSGAVPVVIKSLVFPGTSAIGQPGAR
jgi:ethanolamine utilization protein EutA